MVILRLFVAFRSENFRKELAVLLFEGKQHCCLKDQMGEMDRGNTEVSPKLCKMRPSDNKNGETTRIPQLVTSYQKVRKEAEDYMRLSEEKPKFPIIIECCSEQTP